MDKTEQLRKIRSSLLKSTEELTIAELNRIPDGFNNNIIWNLAHLVSVQQSVCYLRAGEPLSVEESFYHAYKPGTRPVAGVTENEARAIKELLLSSLDRLEDDYRAGRFAGYQTWTTRSGWEQRTIDDALQFLVFHEGMHTGYITAMKRLVTG